MNAKALRVARLSELACVCLASPLLPEAQTTERISTDALGTQANGDSGGSSISADGRFVAFESTSSNLVPGDPLGLDVFVRDRTVGTLERIVGFSPGATGAHGPKLNGDGRFVVFTSSAILVAGDTNGAADIFLYDRQTAILERVSVSSAGSQADRHSQAGVISADGRYVAFESEATNLVAGDTNDQWDVFVHDCQTGTTERISVDPSSREVQRPSYRPSISGDGRFVAFWSDARRLVDGDFNLQPDVFVRDRLSGTTELVSVSSTGVQGNGPSWYPSISADGRFVVFYGQADNLVPGDTNSSPDVFLRDRLKATTERVSLDSAGGQAAEGSYVTSESISPDGRYVVFHSRASSFVAGDTNGLDDIFLRDRWSGQTERVSLSPSGEEGNDGSMHAVLSADGRQVAFTSDSSNLVEGPDIGWRDIYVRDRCVAASSGAFDGDGLNLDTVAPQDVVLGSTWSAPLTLGHPHGSGGTLVLRVRTASWNGPNFVSPAGGRMTEVLVTGPLLAVLTGTHNGSTGDIPAQLIPDDFALSGLTWAAQYTVIGGGFTDLSSAVSGVIGCP